MDNIRKVFTVLVDNREYDVYSIDDKHHEGYNDIPTTWWLYYADRFYTNSLPHEDDTNFIPYSSSINRRLWDISIKQTNTSKSKWGGYEFTSRTYVEMKCNNRLVYGFGSYDYDFCVNKIGYLKIILSEHCFNFFEPETENGRKIFFYGLPATIRVSSYNPWSIGIIPDYQDSLSKDEWWKEYKNRITNITCNEYNEFEHLDMENFLEDMNSDYINWGDALSDGNIGWFR
jgi:hypothetical protein